MFINFIYFIVIIFTASGLKSDTNTGENNELFNELPCLIMGGICIPAADCPDERRAQQPGLCPLQQRMNIECCHSLPSSEKRCHHRGGMCINPNWPCPENLTFKEARDCEDGQQCCILVQ